MSGSSRLIPAHAGKTRVPRDEHVRCGAHPRSRGENQEFNEALLSLGGSSPLTRGKLNDLVPSLAGVRLIPAHAGKTNHADATTPRAAAHPRSRGENVGEHAKSLGSAGSSPLTRGKPLPRPHAVGQARLIPAHAGKTLVGLSVLVSGQAHPRSRGENMPPAAARSSDPGSSPLTRGKLVQGLVGMLPQRLIPAHAGKTRGRDDQAEVTTAHPRSRGENVLCARRVSQRPGSSPLTRGKRRSGADTAAIPRLIPAHAGKTHGAPAQQRKGPAHPRSRGENSKVISPVVLEAGSSPLTRGKLQRRTARAGSRGLIPAHAGKTVSWVETSAVASAHPRSRGENLEPFDDDTHGGGSSPLTRGKPPFPPLLRDGIRLIPAHAGKTNFTSTPRPASPAHPRSRGENIRSGRSDLPTSGSSPLTRGKLGDFHPGRSQRRLIPAHAGKTDVGAALAAGFEAHPRSRGENFRSRSTTPGRRGSSPLTRGKPGDRHGVGGRGRLIPAHAGKT